MSCNAIDEKWKFNHSKLENYQGYLKSNDIINLGINIAKDSKHKQEVFLRSHDRRFSIRDDTFQEVICHSEKLGKNDKVSDFIHSFFYINFKMLNFPLISFFSGALSSSNRIVKVHK